MRGIWGLSRVRVCVLRVHVGKGRLVVGVKSRREVRDGSPDKMKNMLGSYPGTYTQNIKILLAGKLVLI